MTLTPTLKISRIKDGPCHPPFWGIASPAHPPHTHTHTYSTPSALFDVGLQGELRWWGADTWRRRRSRCRRQPPPWRSAGPAAARTDLHPGGGTRSLSAEVEGHRSGTSQQSRGSRGSEGHHNKDKLQFDIWKDIWTWKIQSKMFTLDCSPLILMSIFYCSKQILNQRLFDCFYRLLVAAAARFCPHRTGVVLHGAFTDARQKGAQRPSAQD